MGTVPELVFQAQVIDERKAVFRHELLDHLPGSQ